MMKTANNKISFVTTVYNEEQSIEALLMSLKRQSVIPDEIIIVDAGSTDLTTNKIEVFKKVNRRLNIILLTKKGNRSCGRNFGIKKASNNKILISDAGCILEKNWVLHISKPLMVGYDVSAGFYKPKTTTFFQKALAVYTCFPEEKLNKNFLPSSRSIGFTRNAWVSSGGYPENLNTCEDLVFARTLKNMGLKFKVQKSAIVYWPQRKNFKEAFKQFYSYAYGDGQAGYVRLGTPFLYGRYILLIIFVLSQIPIVTKVLYCFIFLFFYILWSILKNYKYLRDLRALYYLPALQLTADLSVIVGMSFGLISKKNLN